jgi:hypothetical protein
MFYEKFKTIIETLEKINKDNMAIYDLGIDLLHYEEPYSKIINSLFSVIFEKQGLDWIEWYIYERPSFSGTIHKAWDENKKEICYDIPSLWETVKTYIKHEKSN